MSNQILKHAIQEIKAGNKQAGARLLREIIQQKPNSQEAEIAWLWMHRVVDDPNRKILCLQKALKINPENELALEEIRKLQRKLKLEQTDHSDKIFSLSKSNWDSENAKKPLDTVPTPPPLLKTPSGTTVDLTAINLQSILAFVGGFFLILGIFMPIINIPLSGQLNLFTNGRGDGVIILILALSVVVLAALKHYAWVWIPALVTFGLLSSKLINLLRLMALVTS